MKGVTAIEVVQLIGIMAVTISAAIALPAWFNDAAKLFDFSSAEVIARDIAGMISISGAAPGQIKIIYNVEKEGVSYNAELMSKVITLTKLSEGKASSDPVKTTYAIPFVDKTVEEAKTFVIGKNSTHYSFEAIE